jgi:hypothetical protein
MRRTVAAGRCPLRRMYEWEVRLGDGQHLKSCGVTDAPLRAHQHMLDAIGAIPHGQVARGSVTVIELALSCSYYGWFQTLVVVERDPRGEMRSLNPRLAARAMTVTDPETGCPRKAIGLREVPDD